ncbi:MAG: ABC transporter substrate-binding protein [Sandaracinaceae bacterium]|nr:ABC transporter substrate-binding protein [Sandaracinaceae bacterium]
MSRLSWWNGGALAVAVAASTLAAAPRGERRDEGPRAATHEPATGVEPAHRIASASTVADSLLLELCAPSRVVAVTARSAEGPRAHRFEGFPTIRALDDVEAIVALRPEVVVAHNVAEPGRVARLEGVGIRVLDLGSLEGRRTLGEDARAIGALCGAPDAGARWAAAFERRMGAIAARVPPERRRGALYLTIYGDRFMGGTDGTSYHDVLVAAGLVDLAAARFDGWPTYDVEQLLELDPETIVTRDGMSATLCAHDALRALRACPRGMIELDPELLDDPGPGMLDAAEALFAAAYPAAD